MSNFTGLVLKWSHLPKIDFRGKPVGYYVTFFPADLENNTYFMNVNLASNSTLLSNLTAYTTYVINVSAVSSGGIGPANTAKARTQAAGNIKVESVEFHFPSNAHSYSPHKQKRPPSEQKYTGWPQQFMSFFLRRFADRIILWKVAHIVLLNLLRCASGSVVLTAS